MKFRPIELTHKEEIDEYLSAQRIESSELTFLTLYIWRRAFNIRFALAHGCLMLYFHDSGFAPSLRFPLGSGDKKKAAEKACKHFVSNGLQPRFYGLTKDMKQQLLCLCPGKFEIEPMTDYFDYVYSVPRLISLSGKDLHSKRNHLNSFKKLHDYKYMPLKGSDADEINSVYSGWLESSGKKPDYYLLSEQQSIKDVMENYDAIGCKGAKLYANGKLCAFTLGERLNENTAVVHVEKADKDVPGAYAAINQMFLENEWSDMDFVNREDDFGVLGLRRAKKSYRPAFMVEKYSAILRDTEGLL